MMKRKSAVLTDSDSGSGSDSGTDIDKEMLSLTRKKKAPVEKKPKVESASSSGSSDSDSDWSDDGKKKKPPTKKKPGRRTSHRSVSGTQSSSDSENDEDHVSSSTAIPPPPDSSTISSTVKSSLADRVKASSDLEEGEVSSDSDGDSDSSLEEFNDGYDDELMGDAEDRERLRLMTEKDREQELFKRGEQREALKTRFDIEKKLRQARKKEQKRTKKPQSHGSSASVKMDAKERSKERKKTVEGKVDKKTEALDKLKASRDAKIARAQEKDKIRLEQEKKKEEEKDDDLDLLKDDASSVVDKKARKLKASDIYSDDSGSDSRDEDDVKDRKKRSQSSSSSSSSSDSEPDERSRKPQYIDTVADLNRIRLDRPKLEKWVHAPFFTRVVKGCFVRIGIGQSRNNVPVYRIGEITEVVETAKIYKLEKTRTNKGARIRHATDEKVFRFEFVSNSPFTQEEFDRWKDQCNKRSVVLPTKDEVEKKVKELKEAMDYEFQEEDIESIVREKARFRNNPVNFAVKKTELMKRKEMALQTGDDQLVEELQQEIQELDEKAKELDKARSSSIQTISFINERNRKKNVEEAEKAILEEAKANKGKVVEDPFTRRHTKPTVLHRKFANAEGNSPLASFDAALKAAGDSPEEDKKEDKAALSRSLPPLPPALALDLDGPLPLDLFKKDETDGSKVCMSNGDLFSAHDFDIKLDLDAKLPPNLPIVARPSIPQVQELAPRRSLNLEEYKRKKGLI